MSDETVIRQVTSDIWTFSKPFARFGFIPLGGRSTAVKLSNGVWVVASTPLSPETKSTLDGMGEVKWIMAADVEHHLFLAEYKKGYPGAKVIGIDSLVEKKKEEGLILDGAYGLDPPGTLYGFEDEIKSCFFSGVANKDIAWLHVASKTLIQADLLFNLPAIEQYSKSKSLPNVPFIGSLSPFSWAHKQFAWGLGKDKVAMKKDATTVAGWDFDRIIMCHGDVIETDGNKAWRAAYSKYLD